jgi:hypothetical protein
VLIHLIHPYTGKYISGLLESISGPPHSLLMQEVLNKAAVIQAREEGKGKGYEKKEPKAEQLEEILGRPRSSTKYVLCPSNDCHPNTHSPTFTARQTLAARPTIAAQQTIALILEARMLVAQTAQTLALSPFALSLPPATRGTEMNPTWSLTSTATRQTLTSIPIPQKRKRSQIRLKPPAEIRLKPPAVRYE